MLTISQLSVNPSDRLNLTLFLAVAIHAIVIFGISFSPLANELNPTASLEIVLVQQEMLEAPDSAKFLAQANQLASGTTDLENRPSAPFMGVGSLSSYGISPLAMEKTSMSSPTSPEQPIVSSMDSLEKTHDSIHPPSQDDVTVQEKNIHTQRTLEIAQLAAEIAESEKRYAKQPRINYIDTLSAKTAIEARYVKAWVDKVERLGNLNYPDEARRQKLSGSLILHVLLNHDGSIEQVQISSSSGQQVLDDAAIRITKLAEPFERFSQEMLEAYDQLMITRTWMFESGNSLITQ
jgi:protein TonB